MFDKNDYVLIPLSRSLAAGSPYHLQDDRRHFLRESFMSDDGIVICADDLSVLPAL
ncbi:hypothetical protein [Thioalkalivibrio sulfidiphilus]|uniref:hypothetical protein n=1 Tax=Thioalkalivibrio sulfidiphilus TaxID=1033854 RepID=UPI00164F8832|nr:hypothetical protein [Thioalkalivibrio sulfidiphilus]